MSEHVPMLHQGKENDTNIYSSNKRVFWIFTGTAFLIYFVSLAGGFVFDDRSVWEFRNILNIGNLLNVLQFPYWSVDAGLYRPVTLASYAMQYSVFGESAFWFHFINLILYSGTCYLLFRFVDTISQNRRLAFISSLIFLILPIHTEVVANIIGRAEIFSLLFSFLIFLEFLKKSPSAVYLFLWSFLAIGSKENSIAILPIVFLLAYIYKERRDWFACVWPILGVASYFALRFLILGSYFSSVETSVVENPILFTDSLSRVYTAFSVLYLYIENTLWPINLCSNYSFNQVPVLHSFMNAKVVFGFSFFIATILATLFYIKKQPVIAIACVFFLSSYFIVSNLLLPIGTIAGERLMYYPSVGIAILLAYCVCRLIDYFGHTNILKYSLFAVFVFYLAASFVNSLNWLDEERLFTHAATCASNSVMSHSNLGAIYYLRGDYVNAEIELVRANEIYDHYTKGVNNLGLVYWKTGRRELAKKTLLRAMTQPYPYPGALENLALMSIEEGDIGQAKEYLSEFFSGNELLVNQYIKTQCIISKQCPLIP